MAVFVTVLLPLPVRRLFTYTVPNKWENETALYKRVLVPFGHKKVYTGLIVGISNSFSGNYKLKDILSVQDQYPLIHKHQWTFWQWISRYYLCSQGEVMRAALPAPFKLENSFRVLYNENTDTQEITLSKTEQNLIDLLKEKQVLTVQQLQKQFTTTTLYKTLEHLQQKGILSIEEHIREVYKAKKENFVLLAETYTDEQKLSDLLEILDKKAPKQSELLLRFLELKAKQKEMAIRKTALLKQVNSPSALNGLLQKNILTIEQRTMSRLQAIVDKTIPPQVLMPAQKKALEDIRKQFQKLDTVLLHGVTSSGKTEIYIHLIEEQLAQGKQVLYLLPEIALTGQIVYRLARHFGKRVGVYHSKFSESEKVEIWQKVKADKETRYDLILGVRSAIFLPFNDLGLIILDEEHENTYQQQDPAPRYHSRVAASMLIKLYSAKLLLGTATPSLESLHAALVTKRIGYVSLTKRFKETKLPKFEVVDIKKERKKNKVDFSFSWILRDAIQETLDAGEQVILFQNRRGYAPYLQCKQCGWIARCEHCDVSLTYHKYHNKLICHYCDAQKQVPDICPECGGKVNFNAGFGTEKLQEEAQKLFPEARIARMDLDTMRRKHEHEKLIERFENHEVDILIGTQMVAKGLDFKTVGLVGIPDIDALINFPDFRSFERTFQLITQVSGRAGRDGKQGRVILQTTTPQHTLIQQIVSYSNKSFYETQLSERKVFLYPPYVTLLKIILKHKNQAVLRDASLTLKKALVSMFGEKRLLGPVDALVPRIKLYYLKEITIKIEKEKSTQKAKDLLFDYLEEFMAMPAYKSLQWYITVD